MEDENVVEIDINKNTSQERVKNSVRNIITGLLLKAVTIIMPFVIRTIIIKRLGMEYVGLNSLFSSILQVLSLSELGFSITISYALYKPISEDDKPMVCALLNYLKKAYYIIGGIILVAGLIVMPLLPFLIKGSYPADINLYVLYGIFLFNTVISYFVFAYRNVLLSASQRMDIDNNVTVIVNILMYAAQIVALLLTKNYYVYIIFLPVSTIAMNVFKMIMCKRKFPEYFPKGSISEENKKTINTNIKALVGHKLSSVVVSSTDSIIISAFLGLTLLGKFQNYFYIVNSLFMIVTMVYSSITPSVGNAVLYKSKEENLKMFYRLTFLNVLMMGLMSICLLCLFQHFMVMWVGKDNMLTISTVILLVIYFYSWKFKEILNVYKDACGMWNDDFWKPYVISILNIILDLVLVNFIGVDGVLIATILSVPVVSIPWETHVVFKKYFEVSPKTYYIKLVGLTTLICGCAVGTYFVCNLLSNQGIGYFIAKIGICVTLPSLIFIAVLFKTNEFKWYFNKLLSKLKKERC